MDLLRYAFADAGNLLHFAFGVQAYDVGAEVGEGAGGLAVGENAEPGLTLQFQRIGDAGETAGEFLVLQLTT